jgi:hypothetical protein
VKATANTAVKTAIDTAKKNYQMLLKREQKI